MTGGARSDPAAIAPLFSPNARLLLIYDGWCGVCARTVDWVVARDSERRITSLPNQRPGLAEQTGLMREQLDASAWAIDRAGRRFEGAAAINRTWHELGGVWRRLAGLYRLPLLRVIEDTLYRWFSDNRARFGLLGATPGCARPGAVCLPPDTTAGSARSRRPCCGERWRSF
jgi:predicted DCC family thiol-disulfide oxidoreductase YuxK